MVYTEPAVRGVRWADIMDCQDKKDVPVHPPVFERVRPPTPPRRTLQSAINRRKQSGGTGTSSNVYTALDQNVSSVHESTTD